MVVGRKLGTGQYMHNWYLPCGAATTVFLMIEHHPRIPEHTYMTTIIPTRYLISKIISDVRLSVVPMWSCAAVGGTRLREVAPKCGLTGDPENWAQLHRDVVNR